MSGLKRHGERLLATDERTRLRVGLLVVAVLLVAVLYSLLDGEAGRLARQRTSREADLAELLVLRQRHQEAAATAQRLTNRLAAVRPDDTPGRLIDEIGIRGKGVQIRSIKGDEGSGFVEDAAEVKIEGLTAGEAVNLLYRLELGAKPVVVKRALIRNRFDDPARLDLTLAIALLKPPPQGRQ